MVLLGTFLSSAALSERPNILWIIADDLSPELGCYGYEGVQTPHLDRLAGEGARYTSAFATAPVCSTSRSALITGVHQTTTGTHHHRTLDKQPLGKPVEPVTEILRRAGYHVCNSNSDMSRPGKTDYNFQWTGDQSMYDAVDWSERKEGQPFFAQVQIHEPHRNFVAAKNTDRYQNAKIPPYYPEHPVVRKDWSDYLATIEVLDQKVGRILDRLEREGQAKSTVVFFFGDHGRPHYRDKQWLYDGGIQVPLIARWPGNITANTTRPELVSLIDVSATTLKLAGIDIPTWMHGRDMLDDDFVRDHIFAARDRCGSTIDRIRCVRTSHFKYIRNFYPRRPYSQHSGYKLLQYPGLTAARVLHERGELQGPTAKFWTKSRPAEELYDLRSDPYELRNLAGVAKHQNTLTEMRQKLADWINQSDDQGRHPESAQSAAVAASDRWYKSRMQQRGIDLPLDPEIYLEWWKVKLGMP